MLEPWNIKDGYVENPVPAYFVDDVTQDRGLIFQPDVYPFAAELIETGRTGKELLVDVGCGRADKLAFLHAEHPDWRMVGIDYGPNIEWCRTNRSWGEWLDVDLEASPEHFSAHGGLVVASDVIEHLQDPRPMLDSIRFSGCDLAVISTPERDENYGPEHLGPPTNPCHVREWTLAELGGFLEQQGFRILNLRLTRSVNTQPYERTSLALVAPA